MQDTSQVVLHFDFMSESTTQVPSEETVGQAFFGSSELSLQLSVLPLVQAATVAILSASMLGVAILIAEMVIKSRQVMHSATCSLEQCLCSQDVTDCCNQFTWNVLRLLF